MLSESELLILRAAANILREQRDALMDAGIESDDATEKRHAFFTAGAFSAAQDTLGCAIVTYTVRYDSSEIVSEPQSLRVPDDAA